MRHDYYLGVIVQMQGTMRYDAYLAAISTYNRITSQGMTIKNSCINA